MVSTGGSINLIGSLTFATPPYSMICVALTTTVSLSVPCAAGNGGQVSFLGSGNAVFYAGSDLGSSGTYSANAFYRIIGDAGASGSGNVYLNGVGTSGTTGFSGNGSSFALFSTTTSGSYLTGQIRESAFWFVDINSTQAAAMDANMHAYWGF
jgi:hypothetical protein